MTEHTLYNKISKLLDHQAQRLTALESKPAPVVKDGAPGNQGEPGTPGAKGEPGAQGPVGAKGETGARGADGRDGRDGKSVNAEEVAALVQARIRVPKDGETGAQGETGQRGERGQRGPRGERGKQGETGKQGAPGKSITSVALENNKLLVGIDGAKAQVVGELQIDGPDMFVGPLGDSGGGSGASTFRALAKSSMRWLSNYVAGTFVKQNTVVNDAGWLMIANTDTSDRAAPQPTGPESLIYNGTLTPEQDSAKQVTFGVQVNTVQPAYITGYEIDVVAGNFYRVFSVLPGGQVNELISFEASETGWTELSANTILLPTGTEFALIAVVSEPDPTPTTFNGNWNYSKPGGSGGPSVDPVAGQILQANNSQDVLKIHKTDAAVGDRSAELESLTVGDIIESQSVRWAIQNISDQGAFMQFAVAPAVQAPNTGEFNFVFETVTSTPITTGRDVGYWDAQGLPNIRGLKGVDQDWSTIVPSADAFGVNIKIQDVDTSEDWDFMAASSGVAGSGASLRPVEDNELGVFETTDVQAPSGVGLSGGITIHYGPGGSTANGEYTVSPGGIITTNGAAGTVQRNFRIAVRIGRTSASGVSIPVLRFMYAPDGVVGNAVQVGGSFSVQIDDANTTWREVFDIKFTPAIGSVAFVEMFRDEAGDNSGQLQAPQPSGTLAGSNPVATARLEIIEVRTT